MNLRTLLLLAAIVAFAFASYLAFDGKDTTDALGVAFAGLALGHASRLDLDR